MSKTRTAAAAIGRAIRARRNRLGLSLRDVASKALLTESHLAKLERGMVSANIETIDTICHMLQIDLGRVRGLRSYRVRDVARSMEAQHND